MRSKQTLMRWIKKVEKGDSDELEDSAFDHKCVLGVLACFRACGLGLGPFGCIGGT